MSAVIVGRARRTGPKPSASVLAWLTQAVLAMPPAERARGPRLPEPGSIEEAVYADFVEHGPASAVHVARRTALPRQQVRNAVYRLRDRGLIEAVDTERVVLDPPMPAVLRIVWCVRKHPR